MAARESPANRRYRCARGEIEIAVTTAEQWHALAVCIGRPELAYEGSWEAVRTAAPDGPTARVLEGMFAEDRAEIWRRRLEAHAVPCREIT
jgi:crotonobetainyl-CoA:carnitine CoA-transferase CaiB-like acyl-CoA transferase